MKNSWEKTSTGDEKVMKHFLNMFDIIALGSFTLITSFCNEKLQLFFHEIISNKKILVKN